MRAVSLAAGAAWVAGVAPQKKTETSKLTANTVELFQLFFTVFKLLIALLFSDRDERQMSVAVGF